MSNKMIQRYIFLSLILAAGCSHKEIHYEAPTQSIFVARDSPSSIFEDEGVIIEDAGDLAIKEVKQRVILLPQPSKEEISDSAWQNALPITIKTLEPHRFLVNAKHALVLGQHYGIYFREANSTQAKLATIFWPKARALVLKNHDLGMGSFLAVPENRVHFSFEFDQPVHIPDDDAIEVFADNQKLELAQIRVLRNAEHLRISLKDENAFLKAKRGEIRFNRLMNYDQQIAQIDPINFDVIAKAPALLEAKPPELLISHDCAEITWSIDKRHMSELYFAEDLGSYDCLGEDCPREQPFIKNSSAGFKGSYFLTNLKPDQRYHFIVRAEDMQSNVLIAHGSFKTRSQASLRFSEILINPKLQKGQRESSAEFIELFNASPDALHSTDLALIFEDIQSMESRECQIATNKRPLYIAANSHLLLVGEDFDGQGAGGLEGASVFRIPHKKLCGGLPNNRSSKIKVIGEGGQLYDMFGGHLWLSTDGFSIERLDVLRGDYADNYALSSLQQGPTPGR
jgi:hypothetical protein